MIADIERIVPRVVAGEFADEAYTFKRACVEILDHLRSFARLRRSDERKRITALGRRPMGSQKIPEEDEISLAKQ